MNVDTNDPIFVSGVDIQVAFYAIGLLEPFWDMFALDFVEAWKVDFARVVDQGIVDSWNDVVYPVLAVVPLSCNQASCASGCTNTAERVSGISAANRFTDFVAMPPLSPLVHTEHVDNFVRLSQQEGVASDVAKHVSDVLVTMRPKLNSNDFGGFLGSISRFGFGFRRCGFFFTIRYFGVFKVQSHTMRSYMCLCCGLFVLTEFQFECCCARDD